MANIHDFHLSFESNNQSFDLAFREQAASSKNTVLIDGRYYGVVGDDLKILWLRAKLPELAGASGMTLADLKDRLIQLGAKDVSTSAKVNTVGVDALNLKSTLPDEEQLEKVVDFALPLLFSGSLIPPKVEVMKLLRDNDNRQKLELARKAPLPGMPPDKDSDKVNFPPILSELNMRETMLLGAIATILGKNDALESACVDSARSNAPGKILDIGAGRNLHYIPFGDKTKGGNCVIMQSGLGNDAGIWDKVQSLIKNDSYGLSYDRAGLGLICDTFSDNQATMEQILDDLHGMLATLERNQEIQSPYTLVGHSFGGAVMQAYAHLHPDQVKAVVLVDSSSDLQLSDSRVTQEPPPHFQDFPSSDLMPLSTARALFKAASHELSVLEELRSFRSNLELLSGYKTKAEEAGKSFLKDTPLRVLSRGQFPVEGSQGLSDVQQAMVEIQEKLVHLSTDSQQRICPEGIGHYIHDQAPEEVATMIRSLETPNRMQSERKALPAFQHLVAETYWDQYATSVDKDHSMLKKFVSESSANKEQTFADFGLAIDSKNKKLFCSLFSHLEFYQLYRIVGGEKLNIQTPNVSDGPVDVSDPEFLAEVKNYLKERGFTGIVALSDGENDILIRTDSIEKGSIPMSIHSVGKVATGLLVLSLIEQGVINEEDLNKPIQLDEKVMEALPKKVQQRLRETTFLDVMTHKSGIGDYLKGYQDAVQDAVKREKPIPEMTSAESFVKYVDDNLQPVGTEHYSNLGILLVGLSAQHHLSRTRGSPVSYEEALREFVLDPAGVNLFSSLKPEGAVFNADDEIAPHIRGGPAGGQWSTAGDLLKLGKKVGEWSKEEEFGRLLSDFGGEFWNNGELRHAGSIASASAHLTHFTKQNLTVAVLSTTPGFCQATAVAEAIQDRLIAEPLAMPKN